MFKPFPTETPWGRADTVEQIAEGMWFCSTPSHGGVALDFNHAERVPNDIVPFTGDRRFWEEDCDWVIPLALFRDELPPSKRNDIALIMRCLEHHPIEAQQAIHAATDGALLSEMMETPETLTDTLRAVGFNVPA